MSLSFRTLKSDWIFIVLTTSVFVIGLAVAVWDFIQLQKTIWSLGLLNGAGLAAFVSGTVLRQVGKRTLGRSYSYGLRTLEDQKLVQHGVYRYVRHPITLAALIYTPAPAARVIWCVRFSCNAIDFSAFSIHNRN